jgi:uncharacterized protein (TIGR01319 family)
VKIALLADFGSTYTKVAAVDLHDGLLIGQGQARTTTDTDVLNGYEEATHSALRDVSGRSEVEFEIAASSAGGGLRMVAVGLVMDLTARAAEMAALNAGARVEKVMAESLTDDDLTCLRQINPEIVLFAGGTNGGQRQRVLHNADVLASTDIDTLFVIACNAEIADEVKGRFELSGHEATIVSNVMPEIGQIDVDPARGAINRLFLSHVIRGKHLSSSAHFEKIVALATPEAVLNATALLADTPHSRSIGDAVVVTDVGGATTDIYSALVRRPISSAATARKGLATPSVTRTVQGDLGIRLNAPSVLEADRDWLMSQFDNAVDLERACTLRAQEPSIIFEGGWQRDLDERLAVACMTNGLRRHCGVHQVQVGVGGKSRSIQTEPDLRSAGTIIAGGGIIRESGVAEHLVQESLERLSDSVLAPRRCRVLIDTRYVLAAAGLLAQRAPDVAASLLVSEFG